MLEEVYGFLLGVGVTVVIMLVVFCGMVKDVGPCEHEKYSGRVLREYPWDYHPDVSHFTSVDEKEPDSSMNHCIKCGNADNFEWEEIQKGKPWLIKCLKCGHSWTEEEED